MRVIVALVLLLALPLAAAQNASTHDLPVGEGAPGTQESIETGPGLTYGVFVVIGTVGFAAAFAYAAYKYARRPPMDR